MSDIELDYMEDIDEVAGSSSQPSPQAVKVKIATSNQCNDRSKLLEEVKDMLRSVLTRLDQLDEDEKAIASIATQTGMERKVEIQTAKESRHTDESPKAETMKLKRGYSSPPRPPPPKRKAYSDAPPIGLRCKFCGANHYARSCKAYPGREERMQLVRSRQWCLRCLYRHPGPCRSPIMCPCGGADHNRLLCYNPHNSGSG